MIKRLLSRAVPEEEWPVWALPSVIFAGFLLSGVLFYLFYFGPGIRDLQGLAYAPTDDDGRVRLEIGGTLFSVPAHYTRNGRTRRSGQLDVQLELETMPRFQLLGRSDSCDDGRVASKE